MDIKNYLKSCHAAMRLAIIKQKWGISATRIAFPSALGANDGKKVPGT
jgi:hypothetical protein